MIPAVSDATPDGRDRHPKKFRIGLFADPERHRFALSLLRQTDRTNRRRHGSRGTIVVLVPSRSSTAQAALMMDAFL